MLAHHPAPPPPPAAAASPRPARGARAWRRACGGRVAGPRQRVGGPLRAGAAAAPPEAAEGAGAGRPAVGRSSVRPWANYSRTDYSLLFRVPSSSSSARAVQNLGFGCLPRLSSGARACSGCIMRQYAYARGLRRARA